MIFITSTHSGLYLFDIDSEHGKISSSTRLSDGYHYGIWVCSKNSFIAYRGGTDVHSQFDRQLVNWVLMDDGQWNSEVVFSFPESIDAIHQIVALDENRILIANTLYNKISLVELKKRQIIDSLSIGEHGTDINHVNSILELSDNHCLAVLHNRRKKESQLLGFSNDGLEEIGTFSLPGVQCHNIASIDDRLYFNASGDRAVVCLDSTSGKVLAKRKMAEHPKGMCAHGDSIFIGMSNYAARSERGVSSGWISCLEVSNLHERWCLQLRTDAQGVRIGNVNDIRILDRVDRAAFASNFSSQEFMKLCEVGKWSISQVIWMRCKIKFYDSFSRAYKLFLVYLGKI